MSSTTAMKDFPQEPIDPPQPQQGKVVQVSSVYTQNEPERAVISGLLQLSIETQSWGPHTAEDFVQILQERYGLTFQECIFVVTYLVDLNRDDSTLFSITDAGLVVTDLAQQFLQENNAFWFVPEGKPVFADFLSSKSWKTPIPPQDLPETKPSMIVNCLYITIITLLVGVSVAVATAKNIWRKLQGRS